MPASRSLRSRSAARRRAARRRSHTTAQLGEVLGVGTSLGNPLDGGFTALSSAESYFRIIDILLSDPSIDALMVQEELPAAPGTNAKTENLRQVDALAASGGKPIAVVSMISYGFTDHTRGLRAELEHLPVLQEDAKALLRAYGINTPRELVAKGLDEALRGAREIGFPLVLKLVAADVQHK